MRLNGFAIVYFCLCGCSLTTLATYYIHLSGKIGAEKSLPDQCFYLSNSWANVCVLCSCFLCTRENKRRLKLDLTSEINSTFAVTVSEKSRPWLTNSFTLLAHTPSLNPFVIFSRFTRSNVVVFFALSVFVVEPRKNKPPPHFIQTQTSWRGKNQRETHTHFLYNL